MHLNPLAALFECRHLIHLQYSHSTIRLRITANKNHEFLLHSIEMQILTNYTSLISNQLIEIQQMDFQ